MATLKDFTISRNFSIRPTDDSIIYGTIWYVEKGQPYDLVQFSIEEIERYYWDEHFAVPCGTNEDTARYLCERYAKGITEKDILAYKGFLEDGEKWGWD